MVCKSVQARSKLKARVSVYIIGDIIGAISTLLLICWICTYPAEPSSGDEESDNSPKDEKVRTPKPYVQSELPKVSGCMRIALTSQHFIYGCTRLCVNYFLKYCLSLPLDQGCRC
jgi:hypothetical protein